MDKGTFDRLIVSQVEISAKEASQLEELLSSFPYCQAAHLLLAKESHDKNSMLFPQKLKRAAMYALDRKVLHKVIHKKESRSKGSGKTLEVSDFQKKTAFDSNVKLNSPQNFALLKELEDNLKLLREQKTAYSSVLKEVVGEAILPVIPLPSSTETPKKEIAITPNTPHLPASKGVKWPTPLIEDTQLGAELTATTSKDNELEMLLSYLKVDKLEKVPSSSSQDVIISKFIENEPKISRQISSLPEKNIPDLAISSAELKMDLTTENFAQILVRQNKIEKAKEIYKKLMLKYPDKSAYFAAKMNELDSK